MAISYHVSEPHGLRPKLYTVQDVADLVGLTARQVRRHINAGNLRAVALTGTHRAAFYVIFEQDFNEWSLTR